MERKERKGAVPDPEDVNPTDVHEPSPTRPPGQPVPKRAPPTESAGGGGGGDVNV